jgi:16S rRNA G966 N2-methylase RsmD
MARLESQADLMHVPTPDVVCERLREFLDIPEDVHALDPCCGSGRALKLLTGGAGTTYGVELDYERSRLAVGNLSRVLSGCAAQDARMSKDAFGLVLLNPPYDNELEGRLEINFLERSTRWLKPGGVLVFIIKRSFYASPGISGWLSRHFADFHHWRFPDPFFDGPELAFGQSVLVCRKKVPWGNDPAALEALQKAELEPFFPTGDRYRVPSGAAPDLFYPGYLTGQMALELMTNSPVRRVPLARNALGGRSPCPLKQGHVALMLASGRVDGVYPAKGGRPHHVAKGTVRPADDRDVKVHYTADLKASVTITETHGFEIVIRAATPDGKIHDISRPKKAAGPLEPTYVDDSVEDEQVEEYAE